jgi:hypothetical protein
MEDTLFPEECEDSKNQKGNKNQKQKALLFHFRFENSDFQSLPAVRWRHPPCRVYGSPEPCTVQGAI